ncbi:hypothetical protein AB0B48_01495 [Micromonospora sp. NPDC049089]|uniref:hypothetical protein n=1 Tax=unclassified Micromonospora TaxID=2617518 RepID=UPI0033E9343B
MLDVRRGLICRLIRIAIPELDRRQPADLTARLTADSTMVQHPATRGMIKLIDATLHLVFALIIGPDGCQPRVLPTICQVTSEALISAPIATVRMPLSICAGGTS